MTNLGYFEHIFYSANARLVLVLSLIQQPSSWKPSSLGYNKKKITIKGKVLFSTLIKFEQILNLFTHNVVATLSPSEGVISICDKLTFI